jgi:hypothetical protein
VSSEDGGVAALVIASEEKQSSARQPLSGVLRHSALRNDDCFAVSGGLRRWRGGSEIEHRDNRSAKITDPYGWGGIQGYNGTAIAGGHGLF